MKKIIFCFALLSAILIGMVSAPSASAEGTLEIGPMEMAVGWRFQGVVEWTEDAASSGAGTLQTSIPLGTPDGLGTDYTQEIYDRHRIWLKGKIGDHVSFVYQTDEGFRGLSSATAVGSNQGGLETRDAYVTIHFFNELNLSAGVMKIPFSRLRNESAFNQLTVARPFIEAMATQSATGVAAKRDRTVMLWGNLFEDRIQYRATSTDGVLSLDGEDKNRYGGRVHVALLDPEPGLGYAGTYRGTKTILTIGGGLDSQANTRGTNAAPEDNFAWTIDGLLEYPLDMGVPSLQGAYFNLDTNDTVEAIEGDGWYLQAGWLFPEVAALFGGDVQFFGKYTTWSPDTKTSINNRDEYGLGANLYLAGQNVKLVGQWQQTTFDSQVASTTAKDFSTFTTMVQVQFK